MRRWGCALALVPGLALVQEPPRQLVSPDLGALDRSVAPCDDFYRFACGGWMKANPIPPDKSRWGRFDELGERNLHLLRELLEESARYPEKGPTEQKVGDLYASCMDEKAAEAKGARPVQPDLRRVAGIKARPQLVDEVVRMHRAGVPALFEFGSMTDFHDATRNIAAIDQGGLTLPDRDYYLKDDAKSVETREKLVEHVRNLLRLLGRPAAAAATEAATVLRVETGLAKASMDRTARRDPQNLDHPTPRAELPALAAAFDFPRYLGEAGAPPFDRLNVNTPDFFKQVGAQLGEVPLADWKTYLAWRRLKHAAPYLSAAFVDEDFRFSNQYLMGQKEIAPRWKRCTRLVDSMLGEALGRLYVDRHFGGDAKAQTLKLVAAVEQAMGKDIDQIAWMGAETKTQAHAKLAAIANNMGYPDRWRDYGAVKVARADLVGNIDRAAAFEVARDWNKIGKPVDRKEWEMSPPTVNAYYRGSRNDINFPAGILQPPFFNAATDAPVNLGAIGAVIGHELTHGFDDKGRKFDAQGNLRNWWTDKDATAFEERASCIDRQYAGYVAVKDDKGEVHLNGKLTLGENTADNGGVRLALMALAATLPKDAAEKKVDAFTPQQRFFLGYAQIWCQNITDQAARVRALTDPHSPGRYRVDGVLSNMPEFAGAFACKAGQAMVSKAPCRVW